MDLVLARLDLKLEEAGDLGACRVQAHSNDLAVRDGLELDFRRLEWRGLGGSHLSESVSPCRCRYR